MSPPIFAASSAACSSTHAPKSVCARAEERKRPLLLKEVIFSSRSHTSREAPARQLYTCRSEVQQCRLLTRSEDSGSTQQIFTSASQSVWTSKVRISQPFLWPRCCACTPTKAWQTGRNTRCWPTVLSSIADRRFSATVVCCRICRV